jgi:Copper amine oxidase N-terminal domain
MKIYISLHLSGINGVICLDGQTGNRKWTVTDGSNNPEAFELTEEYLYILGRLGIYSIEKNTGEKNIFSRDFLWLSNIETAICNRKLFYFEDDVPSIICFDGTFSIEYTVDKASYAINKVVTSTDTSPQILNGRTLLPARFVINPLDGEIKWDSKERKVTCELLTSSNLTDDMTKVTTVELWIGKSTAKLNGVEVQIDPDNPEVVPTIINDRTMVPMRFLAESLGCSVEWIAESKEIILTYTP